MTTARSGQLTARAAEAKLKTLAEPDRVADVRRFFKAGPGQSGR